MSLVTSERTDNFSVFAGSETVGFACANMPPNIRIYVYVNNENITHFCSPTTEGALLGDPIFTDQLGTAAGLMYIPSIEGRFKFPVGEIRITFGDNAFGIERCKYISETSIYNHGLNVVDTEQGGTISLRKTEKIRTFTEAAIADEGSTSLKRLDPLAQTFVVDETKYPVGLVITGVTLFVYEKDPNLPLAVEIRPMVGNAPSTTEYLSGTFCVLNPDAIQDYDIAANRARITNFNFQHPIYLKPAEYAIVITTKSKRYTLLSSTKGPLSPKKAFVGRLFKPQNSGNWVGTTNEDLTFYLRKARFETGTNSFIAETPQLTGLEYNKLRLLSTDVSLGDSAFATYKVRTTNAGTEVRNNYQDILPGSEANLVGRQTANTQGDISVQVSMTSKNADVSPILDRQLLKAQIFRNTVRAYSEEASATELNPRHGLALSRYISKVIPLQEGFDSTGMSVQLDVNRKVGTDIEVFVRVLAREDKSLPNGIYDRPFIRMRLVEPTEKTFAGTEDSVFFSESYRLLDRELRYVNNLSNTETTPIDSASYDKFAYYQIKVVFYSSNPVYLPKIKNLVATALL